MQIKKIEKISDRARQKISLAQNAVNQNNTGENISINGQQWRYIKVPLPDDPTLCQSVSIIDKNGNGLLFTYDGLPSNGLCFQIENNKIISDIVYSDANFSYVGPVIAKLLVNPNNSELLETLLRKYKEVLPKTSKTSTANIENIKPKPKFNTLKLSNGYTISARRNEQNQINSIMITDVNGNGKCFYSDGYMNPVRNGKTVPGEGKQTNGNEFSNLQHQLFDKNYLAVLNNVEAIMKDTKKESKQFPLPFTEHNKSLNQENLIIPLKNGYTISVRRNEQNQINRIMITDANGNGKCFYSDGYMNPVKNRNVLPLQGEQHAFHKSFFSSLRQAIIEHKPDYLEKLVTQNMTGKLNLKIFQEMIDSYKTNKLPSTYIGQKHDAARYQVDNENFYIVDDGNFGGYNIYFKNSEICMELNDDMEIVRWDICDPGSYKFVEQRFNTCYTKHLEQNQHNNKTNIDDQLHQKISSPDNKPQIIQFSNGLKISARLKPIPGQNASIMITDANGNGKCFYSDGYVNQVIHRKPIVSQYEKNKIQHFTQLKILIDTQRYKSLKDLCSELIENTINTQNGTYDKPSFTDQLSQKINTQNSHKKTIEEFNKKYQTSNFNNIPQNITQRKHNQSQNKNIIIPSEKNSKCYYNKGYTNNTDGKPISSCGKKNIKYILRRKRMLRRRMLRRRIRMLLQQIQNLLNLLLLRKKINTQNSDIDLNQNNKYNMYDK